MGVPSPSPSTCAASESEISCERCVLGGGAFFGLEPLPFGLLSRPDELPPTINPLTSLPFSTLTPTRIMSAAVEKGSKGRVLLAYSGGLGASLLSSLSAGDSPFPDSPPLPRLQPPPFALCSDRHLVHPRLAHRRGIHRRLLHGRRRTGRGPFPFASSLLPIPFFSIAGFRMGSRLDKRVRVDTEG